MDQELTEQTGRYWILYFQPLPEAGECIAFALVFQDRDGRPQVEYDSAFAKVLKMYPDTDSIGLSFYLNTLQSELSFSAQAEIVLRSYGPQIAASTMRRIKSPLTRKAIDMLLARYVFPAAKKTHRANNIADPVGQEIEAFIRSNVHQTLEWRTRVRAQEILGHSVTGAKRVAIAIPCSTGWTLIDGVDLNKLAPAAAANRADEVSRTFWNYSRAATESKLNIRRVGVVLNGNSHMAAKTDEAHDYALHRLQTDADLAIDASSPSSGPELRRFLTTAGVIR